MYKLLVSLMFLKPDTVGLDKLTTRVCIVAAVKNKFKTSIIAVTLAMGFKL